MANLTSQDVRSQIGELKRRLAGAIADEQRLYQRSVDEKSEADRWRKRAELAVARGVDDLARAALERSTRHAQMADEAHRRFLEQKKHVEWLKSQLLQLELRMREGLAAVPPRAEAAALERRLAQLERWEERAREERARIAAWAELERDEVEERLAALERETLLEQQLAELKRRLGKG